MVIETRESRSRIADIMRLVSVAAKRGGSDKVGSKTELRKLGRSGHLRGGDRQQLR